MKSASPFLKALKPTVMFLVVFLLLAIMFGDKNPIITAILGLPWIYILHAGFDLPYTATTLIFPWDIGVWINVILVYACSVWCYSRKMRI